MPKFTRGSRIAIVGAVMAAIGFLLPWCISPKPFTYPLLVPFWGWGQGYSTNGFQVAQGVRETSIAGVSEPKYGSPLLFAALGIVVLVCVLFGVAFTRGRIDMFATAQGVLGVMGMIIIFAVLRQTPIWYVAYRSFEYGFWVTMLGLAGVILGCLFFPRISSPESV